MDKQQYKELLRLRKQEENYIRIVIVSWSGHRSVREMYEDGCFGNIHINRLCYVLLKWVGQGYYDYGVNILQGWLTLDKKWEV